MGVHPPLLTLVPPEPFFIPSGIPSHVSLLLSKKTVSLGSLSHNSTLPSRKSRWVETPQPRVPQALHCLFPLPQCLSLVPHLVP
ncbi:rCG45061, isoform CRA_b [Rattus norvegicus]|uniref:RCG45061, isoform CRA_b n=1 Tax=Rattus norvegicus TaxID=10116 RepID=A6KQV5_RAT|nr:rCG45061, isoform CRA_b [Rattus norvegicus]